MKARNGCDRSQPFFLTERKAGKEQFTTASLMVTRQKVIP